MVNTRRPKLLLVADHTEVIEAARQLLDQRGAVVAAASVDKVLLHLDPSVDLIIALDVPPARMVPLLQLMGDTPAGRKVPVTFVDLARLRHRHGALAADEQVRRLADWHWAQAA